MIYDKYISKEFCIELIINVLYLNALHYKNRLLQDTILS